MHDLRVLFTLKEGLKSSFFDRREKKNVAGAIVFFHFRRRSCRFFVEWLTYKPEKYLEIIEYKLKKIYLQLSGSRFSFKKSVIILLRLVDFATTITAFAICGQTD